MKETLKEILQKIEKLQDEMRARYDEMAKKYGYAFEKRKVRFQEAFRAENRKEKISVWRYVISKNLRFIISMPFIYGMIFRRLFSICVSQFTSKPLFDCTEFRV